MQTTESGYIQGTVNKNKETPASHSYIVNMIMNNHERLTGSFSKN